ncbi:glycosyltransferase family 4 protein [Nocardia sp. NPDC046473]|uniref:glycosyltransferase family 4 protein n=1 Tax=Nocardia sp. NPDC046473 TaxID=3155733 RepID=UPI0033C8CBBE
MKIGVIASVAHRTPPKNYGPWEHIASTLAEGFVARGHDVTLFATGDSETSARLVAPVASGYEETADADAKVAEALHNSTAFEHAGEFDVLANHFDFMPLTYSRLVSTPMVTTIHGFSSPKIVPVYKAFDDIAHYVAISDADRHPALRYAATIHHGIDTAQFTFRPEHGEYLLFLGRIHPDKGTHLAIEVARLTGLPLIIAGVVQDEEYFRTAVEPHLSDPAVTYVGPVGPARRDELLGGARALLHLIGFAEPFGLAVVEALATGTPVIATPLGSMPEIIRDGVTGFLVTDVAGAAAALAKVDQLDRRVARDDVCERFSAERMIDDYLALFERIVPASPAQQGIGSPGLFSHAGL